MLYIFPCTTCLFLLVLCVRVRVCRQSAATFLGMQFGTVFKYLWAVGLLASGQVATLTLTYAGQVIMLGLLNVKVGH